MSTITKTPAPGEVNEAWPEIFDIRAMPKQPSTLKEGQLEEAKIRQFFEKGYLIVPDYFKKEELEACKKDINCVVDDLAKMLYEGGKIKSLYEDKGFYERLTFIENDFPGSTILPHKSGRLTNAMRALWSNERLLNLMEQLIGPEIMGHPVWNLRTKTPQNEASTVPWHQDSAYLDNDSYTVLQPAAWIPMLDANEQNGCMEVISGGHLKGKVCRHTCCWRNTWYVMLDEKEMEETLGVNMEKDKVLCPVPYGGMLLINNLIPHRSLNNLSDQIRWSFDFRWQRPDKAVGFYGLKQGVMMRSQKNPIEAIDWDGFTKIERHVATDEKFRAQKKEEGDDKFDTTIVGPWMKKWEMTHTNRHTARLSFLKDEVSWHKA